MPGEVNPLAASIQSPTNQKPMRRRVEFEGRRPWQGAANGIDASQLTRFARCGCLNARDGSVRITQGADPVGAIPDKGSFAPFAQDSPSESGEAQMPLCLSGSLPFCLSSSAYAFSPLRYRELGFRAGTALLPEWENGKDEKGERNLKSRFQFFLRCCEV